MSYCNHIKIGDTVILSCESIICNKCKFDITGDFSLRGTLVEHRQSIQSEECNMSVFMILEPPVCPECNSVLEFIYDHNCCAG